MKNLNLIKEQVIKIAENKDLITEYFPDYFKYNDEEDQALVIYYLDKQGKHRFITGLFGGLVNEMAVGFRNDFKKYISYVKPKNNINNLVFCIDLYSRLIVNHYSLYNNEEWKEERANFLKNNPIARDLLSETDGIIMYHFQFSNILRLLFPEMLPSDIIDLQKNYGKKKPEAVKMVEEVKIDDDFSLREIIKHCMIFGYWIYPSWRGAYNLYKLIFD
ncbi:hypothetical protein ACFL6I_14405 [candidate division KSB1 bacterium]